MKLDPDFVPSSVDEAIDTILAALTPEDRAGLLDPENVALAHMAGPGAMMRNSWSMWDPDTPLVQDFRQRFDLFGHGDDVYGMIIGGVVAELKGEEPRAVVLERRAEEFRRHWRSYGLDPKTGKNLKTPVPPDGGGTRVFTHNAGGGAPEMVRLIPDDGTGKVFDTMLHAPGMLQDLGDLHLVTKSKATEAGKPVVMLSFTAVLPNGEHRMVQTVTTLQNLVNAVEILKRREGLA